MNSGNRIVQLSALVIASMAILACHPLINEFDPGADNFTGERFPEPKTPVQILPDIERWESVVPHGGRQLPLMIPDRGYGETGFFVEPRVSSWYYIRLTFAAPFDEQDIAQAGFFTATNNGTANDTEARQPFQVDADNGTVVYRFPAPLDGAFTPEQVYQSLSVRMRLVDLSGTIIGEREFGLLVGDFNGDGLVDNVDIVDGPETFEGTDLGATSTPTIKEIRSDLNSDGYVDVDSTLTADDNDTFVISNGTDGVLDRMVYGSLPGPPPTFGGSSTPVFSVGDTGPAGGIVFYDKGLISDGWRYLEVSPTEVSGGVAWDAGAAYAGSTLFGLGEGGINTARAIEAVGTAYAAGAAQAYAGPVAGFDDWYLPTEDELALIHLELYQPPQIGTWPVDPVYWSSTNIDGTTALAYDFFFAGSSDVRPDTDLLPVRAVRAFRNLDPSYNIIYYPNAPTFLGDVPLDPAFYAAGTVAQASPNTGALRQFGRLFDGWNEFPSGGGAQYYGLDPIVMPGGNLSLYAQWYGPSGQWEFAPGSELIDDSGNGNDFTSSVNPAFRADFLGLGRDAVELDQNVTRWRADFPGGISAGDGASVSLWIYGDTFGPGALLSAYDSSSGLLFYIGSDIAANLNVADGSFYTTPGGAGYQSLLTAGAWNHVAMIMNSSAGTTEVYVNGALENSVTGRAHAALMNQTTLYLGNNGQGTLQSDAMVGGIVASVRVYDRPLTPDDVTTIFNE